ncbi:hypothetical protein LTR94_036100, partial [Friedmanniomyces endolithicus]
FDFTPDAKAVLIGTNENGEFQEALRHDLATGENTPLIQADWDVSFVFYSPTGRYRVSGLNEDAKTALTLLDTATDRPVALSGLPDGDIGNVRFSDDERSIAFTVSSDTSPAD